MSVPSSQVKNLGLLITIMCYVISQKSTDLIHIVMEAWNHAWYKQSLSDISPFCSNQWIYLVSKLSCTTHSAVLRWWVSPYIQAIMRPVHHFEHMKQLYNHHKIGKKIWSPSSCCTEEPATWPCSDPGECSLGTRKVCQLFLKHVCENYYVDVHK
jgi:hypothetical protein